MSNVEIARVLRLTRYGADSARAEGWRAGPLTAAARPPPASDAVEPVHFHVPRAEQLRTYFQDDLFPPAPTGAPGTTAGDWFGGYNAPQPRASLCPEDMTPLSEKPAEKQEVGGRLPLRRAGCVAPLTGFPPASPLAADS